MQLRRWAEAGMMLNETLSRPTRTPQARLQGLIYLATVLGRFGRFGDAVLVYEHLLEIEGLDPATIHGLKLGRAMSLLREERLFDVDRAISELRRSPNAEHSAGLALIEMYRDVKTGHPREALEMFERKRELLRHQLGHRCADAWLLAAAAYDAIGEAERASAGYENAALLAPRSELMRRYPEASGLDQKYPPPPAPAEVG
jgi:tetratricopeptide (TPR) repeat protein